MKVSPLVAAAGAVLAAGLGWVALTAPAPLGAPAPSSTAPHSATVAAPMESSAAPEHVAPTRLHVTAAGDYSSTEAAHGVLERIAALKPDLNLGLGDLSYGRTGNEKAWCDLVRAEAGADIPFELVPGNHESNGENGRIEAFAECLPNRLPGLVGSYPRQYYVDVPQGNPLARIIVISPGMDFPEGALDYSEGSERYNWTAGAIDSARGAGIPWVLVAMHEPCLSMGEKACEPGEGIANLLIRKRVDIVLTGHEHLYQRTHQLATSPACPRIVAEFFNPACIKDSGSELDKGAGTVFVTAGTGGRALRSANTADREARYFATYAALNSNPAHGLADLQLTATNLTYSFVSTDSTYADRLTISKPADRQRESIQ